MLCFQESIKSSLITHFLASFLQKLLQQFRLNLTLNRDKELDDSQDELAEEIEELKAPTIIPPRTKKAPPMRSRSVLGCDQIGIETLVSMLNSGESDSEKEDGQQAPQAPPIIKNEPPPQRIRANMLRKTGKITFFKI